MTQAAATNHGAQVKETLVSIIIAFILAFVFRAFVIEAFVIPTGSMAPTLMGAHMRFQGENTGYEWPVGPQFNIPGTNDPLPVQGGPGNPVFVHDPMSREEIQDSSGVRRQAGDRILVFKYLYSIYDPRRFDVVVFKAPHQPQENYIKRLVGLPGEMLALIDGDVFVRRPAAGEKDGAESWSLPGWQVQRKPERAQRAMWQDVYSSEYAPRAQVRSVINARSTRQFHSPWLGGDGWAIENRTSYDYAGSTPTTLSWDNQPKPGDPEPYWPVNDFCYYNDTQHNNPQSLIYAVSDVSMKCGVEPKKNAVDAAAVLRARGHEFRAEIKGTAVTLKMGPLGAVPTGNVLDSMASAPGPTQWTTLGTGVLPRALEPGRITDLEFWHTDQALWLWCDGKLVAHGEYNWTPEERLAHALGTGIAQVTENWLKNSGNILGNWQNYRQPVIRWEFAGGPLSLYRVGLQRDQFYQPGSGRAQPPRGAHPLFGMHLGADQFFVCGDNSPESLDARLWPAPDPWVAATIDKTEGVVPRDLMIGRAFFVYFPSMIKGKQSGLPVPDFGRLRWIW